jgi:4-amino-4-deoxy-L-arabinose transferase-like glycosyltransferase
VANDADVGNDETVWKRQRALTITSAGARFYAPKMNPVSLLQADRENPAACTRVDRLLPSHEHTWGRSVALYLVVIAFVVRIAFMVAAHTYRFDSPDDSLYYGETTWIGASIAEGRGFSSPFGDANTGPTAWVAPVYPYFCALIFMLFGVFSRNSALVLLTVQSALSALTCIPILSIAERTFGRRTGYLAATLWAVFPWFSKWAVTWVWEISLSALLFTTLFSYALALGDCSSRRAWLGFGALWGFALLANPALLVLFPVSLAWCGYKLHGRNKHWLKPAILSIAVCSVVISPWLVRNRLVFGRWVFLRSNFGMELALGNYHLSFGRGWGGRHPTLNPAEKASYRELGELDYLHRKTGQALEFIRQYPWEFTTLTAKRVWYFWDGSAMSYRGRMAPYWLPSSFACFSFLLLAGVLVAHRKKVNGWQMFFGAILAYPVPYYLTYSQVRYRHVLEPLMLLLVSYAAVELVAVIRAGCRAPAVLFRHRQGTVQCSMRNVSSPLLSRSAAVRH